MKCIPAGAAILTLLFASLPIYAQDKETSAEQLAEQEGLNPGATDTDESASQLAGQEGLNPGTKDTDESASQLAGQEGLNPGTKDTDESASQLAGEDGLNPGTKDAEQSAQQLENQEEGIKTPPPSSAAGPSVFGEGEGVDGTIFAAVAQPDGKVVIGGQFENVNAQPRWNLARINADGSLDTTFLPKVTDSVNGNVFALAIDANGGILVGGLFSQAQELPRKNFVRYLPNGTLDQNFNDGNGPNGKVLAIAVQPDGKIVIGGEFSEVGTAQRRNIARFNSDTTLDGPLTGPGAVTGTIRSLAVLPSGGVIVGGEFEISGRTGRNLMVAPGGAAAQ